MTVKKTITLPDTLYEKLKLEATTRQVPLNRFIVKHLQDKISNAVIIDAQRITDELFQLRKILVQNRNLTEEDVERIRAACRCLESFLVQAEKKKP